MGNSLGVRFFAALICISAVVSCTSGTKVVPSADQAIEDTFPVMPDPALDSLDLGADSPDNADADIDTSATDRSPAVLRSRSGGCYAITLLDPLNNSLTFRSSYTNAGGMYGALRRDRDTSPNSTHNNGKYYFRIHYGADLATGRNVPVYAAASGRVHLHAVGTPSYLKGYGNSVVMTHPGGHQTLYAHLSEFSEAAKTAEKTDTAVAAGTQIGKSGTTDIPPRTSPHVHFELSDGSIFDRQNKRDPINCSQAPSGELQRFSGDPLFARIRPEKHAVQLLAGVFPLTVTGVPDTYASTITSLGTCDKKWTVVTAGNLVFANDPDHHPRDRGGENGGGTLLSEPIVLYLTPGKNTSLVSAAPPVTRASPCPSPSSAPTNTPVPSPPASATPSAGPTPTGLPTPTATPVPTASPTSAPTRTPTPAPTPTPTPSSSPTPTPSPTTSPSPGPPSCSTGLPYCVTDRSGNVRATQAGFGYSYSGTMTFSFSPALPATLGVITAQFNASSMKGTAIADGSSTLTFAISGSSLACQLVNPTTVLFFPNAQQVPGTQIASDTFNWNPPGC